MKDKLMSWLPGIALFIIALVIGLKTYQDYGISWDEPRQREIGTISYNYVFNGDKALLTYPYGSYGVGFELPLIWIEKHAHLTDTRDIYLMRHLVNHLFFLFAVLCGYFLVLRLFRNPFLACLGFLMFILEPRIYAHSFFNSKDVAFLSMFLITFNLCQYAFEKKKTWLIFALGLLCGYTTSIRIMGIILGAFIGLCLVFDTLASHNFVDKKSIRKPIINLLLFIVGFCVAVIVAWPYLWAAPVTNFITAFKEMSRYDWDASTLLNGSLVKTTELPWTYFPSWFTVTTPVLWLAAGFVGIWFIVRDFFSKAKNFITNRNERNFLLYLFCFLGPVMAVIMLHSIIYDDWRHLYFVYPSFVLIGLYFFNKILTGMPRKFRWIPLAIAGAQAAMVGQFMVTYHPFHEVYFNELVSHADESLRENYELDYWGPSFKQGLEYLIANSKTDTIRVACNYDAPLMNNILILPAKDRPRIKLYEISQMAKADYFVTNFRGHPEDYPSKNIIYSIKVLNSSILNIYGLEKKTTTIKK